MKVLSILLALVCLSAFAAPKVLSVNDYVKPVATNVECIKAHLKAAGVAKPVFMPGPIVVCEHKPCTEGDRTKINAADVACR